MHRLHTALIGFAALLTLTACSAQGSGASSEATTNGTSSGNSIGTPLNASVPESVRNLTFTTSDGKRTSLAALTGRIVVLSDAMTLCQETCPLDTATLVQTARAEAERASAEPPVFISLTVDPARDTRAQLQAYRRLFTDPPGDWQAWTGSAKNVNALWNYLGVWRKRVADDPGPAPRNWRTGAKLTYDVQHSDEVFFFDTAGRERFVLEGVPDASRGSVPRKLRQFMSTEGTTNLDHPAATAWTEAQAETVITSLRRR